MLRRERGRASRDLGGEHGAVAVGVEEAEVVAQVLDGGRVAFHGGVERRELVQADEAAATAAAACCTSARLTVTGRRAVPDEAKSD